MKNTPRKKLQSWSDKQPTRRHAADLLGLSTEGLRLILTGARWPGLQVALAIEEHAGIPIAEWRR